MLPRPPIAHSAMRSPASMPAGYVCAGVDQCLAEGALEGRNTQALGIADHAVGDPLGVVVEECRAVLHLRVSFPQAAASCFACLSSILCVATALGPRAKTVQTGSPAPMTLPGD